MADVGGSTNAHSIDGADRLVIIRLLTNWSDWLCSLDDPCALEVTLPPMFKGYVAGYRESSGQRIAESPDKAERLDTILTTLEDRHKACLITHYVMRLNSSKAAKKLQEHDQVAGLSKNDKGSLGCTDKTYEVWLTKAEDIALLRITYAQGVHLDEPIKRRNVFSPMNQRRNMLKVANIG